MSLCNSVLFRGLSLAAFGLVLGAGAVQAQTPEARGWYVGVLGGLNFTEETSADTRIKGVALGKRSGLTGADAEISHKRGWAAGGLAGYDFGTFRLQADVIFRRNVFDKTTVSGVEGDASGRVSSLAPMVSALYDIPTGTSFVPYIGAGVGASRTTVRSDGAKEGKWGVAYQGIAGLRYDMSRNLALGVEYRYFATPERDFNENNIKNYGYHNHSAFIALTYKFAQDVAPPPEPAAIAAPPPPAPVPAPAAPELARSYLVFFDWNAATVTTEAATIITEAATAARQLAVTRIEVTGHADRSGTPAYNQKLSEKRGAAVKAALVHLGVLESQITVVGKGETSPLVPTADGVREPPNRRVEIVLP